MKEDLRSFRVRLSYFIAGVFAVGIVLLAYSYLIEPNRLVRNSQEIRIKNWNRAFDGLRIVAIGDIHGGSNGVDKAKLRQVVELTNAQDPDLIVLLGDYVSQTGRREPGGKLGLKMSVADVTANLAGLKAKLGVFVVLGNHDLWFSNAEIASSFEAVGYRVLDGKVVQIERNGAKLRILGLKDHLTIDNWKRFSSDAKKLLANSEGDGDVIVLEHSPDVLPMITGDKAISGDTKLMLSAHTHGGQVWLPILGRPMIPSMFGQKYAAGHVKDGGMDLFVTSGVGCSILPFRFMVPPEIAVLTIRSG